MKFNKLISIALTAFIALQLFVAGAGAAIVKTENGAVVDDNDWTPPLSISEPLPEGNLFRERSAFDTIYALGNFAAFNQNLDFIEDANGGYFKASGMSRAYLGFSYSPPFDIPAGTYKFAGYFRTANKDEITMLRITVTDYSGNSQVFKIYCGDEWFKAEFYFTVADYVDTIKVSGGPDDVFIQEYCLDNWSIVEVDSIPEGASDTAGDMLGLDSTAYRNKVEENNFDIYNIEKYDPKKNAKYDVNGIIINSDISQFVASCADETCTPEDIINFAKQFEGTHVTDYFINVAGWVTNYPSDRYTDFVEKYHMIEENGEAVDYTETSSVKGAHYIFDTLAADYIGLWHEAFPQVGINPWISFRMNDIHVTLDAYNGKANAEASEFLYNHPEYRRAKHHPLSTTSTNFDYSIPEVREYFLGIVNEALDRYGSYGIELDFMREAWLFYPGGEYKGLDILNDFMRQINDIVDFYSIKYGHDIKVAVRVPSDVQTAYDFGIDVVTWAAEGLVDMVIPTSRWDTTDMDIPVKIWDSILTPFDVELAAGIETRLRTWQGSNIAAHSLETFAGYAANAFSQGADKIYFYNYFLGVNDVFTEDIKYSTDSTYYNPTSLTGYWNVITSIGSYEKLMTMNRRHLISYNDVNAAWKNRNQYFPVEVKETGFTTLRVAVGDIPEGAKLTLKIACDNDAVFSTPPIVYVNSVLCEYIGKDSSRSIYFGTGNWKLTDDMMLCYDIPAEAHDEFYMHVEMQAAAGTSFSCDDIEVYVKAHN